MASVEPIIVVLGPFAGGTSAVAGVLHHLGVFMGGDLGWTYRYPHETWEETQLRRIFDRACTTPGGQLRIAADIFRENLRGWADEHRRAARGEGRPPGVKHPLLCVAVDDIRAAWGPVLPVVVDRPAREVVAALNKLGWWTDEQERIESTAHLIASRDRALADTATVRIDFEEFRATPEAVIRRLAAELHLDVTEAQVAAAVDSVVHPSDVRREGADLHREMLDRVLSVVERNPTDPEPVKAAAGIYADMEDFANARKWYERLIELGGSDEDVYYAMWRIAGAMARLGEPWPDIQDAYLRAWEFRPTRAEPLYAIGVRHRSEGRYQLGYLFARDAAAIPLPADDLLFDDADIYAWRALDEQAACASWIGKHAESFGLCRRLLARSGIPAHERDRIAVNRDFGVPAMLEASSSYPEAVVATLAARRSGAAEVTVSLLAGPDRGEAEATLNSFLNCCTDIGRVGRFLVVDTGLSAADRAALGERYGFVEFVDCGADLASIRCQVGGRFWLHLGRGFRFFAPESFVGRLTAVLDAEPDVVAVGVNFGDAAALTGVCAAEEVARRADGAGRYVLSDAVASGPALFDCGRLDEVGGLRSGLRAATLDEVLCVY